MLQIRSVLHLASSFALGVLCSNSILQEATNENSGATVQLEFNNSNEWKTFPFFYFWPSTQDREVQKIKHQSQLRGKNMKNVCMQEEWEFMMANLFS